MKLISHVAAPKGAGGGFYLHTAANAAQKWTGLVSKEERGKRQKSQ